MVIKDKPFHNWEYFVPGMMCKRIGIRTMSQGKCLSLSSNAYLESVGIGSTNESEMEYQL